MQAYYEVEAEIPSDHTLHLQLPDNIPTGKAKIAIIYELTQMKTDAVVALKEFLNKYQASDIDIDIDTSIFEENRKSDADRDFRL